MNGKRFALLTGLALLGSMAAGRADAAYNYSTVVTINSGTGGGSISNSTLPGGLSTYTLADGTQLQFQNIAQSAIPFLPGGPLSPNIAFVGIIPTRATPGDTFSVNYTDVITINNPAGSGTIGTFTITGTLTANNVSLTSGQFSGTTTNTFSAPLTPVTITVDGNTFTLVVSGTPDVGYSSPTIGVPATNPNGNGSLSATLTSSPSVPEPASVVLMGLGLGLVGVVGLRRRAA